MAWRAISEADVRSVLSDSELAALSRAAGPEGMAERVAAQITAVTGTVRGHVAANPHNRLGPAGTVPETLLQAALAILAVDIPAQMGGLNLDPRGVRKEARREALKLLEAVAANRFEILDDEGGSSSSAPTPPSAYTKPRVATRERSRGVL